MYISLTEARGLGSHCAVGGRLRRQRSYGWGLVAIDRGGGLREPGGSSTGLGGPRPGSERKGARTPVVNWLFAIHIFVYIYMCVIYIDISSHAYSLLDLLSYHFIYLISCNL